MLPEKMKEVLMKHVNFSNPKRDPAWFYFKAPLDHYERHCTFLDACGHDTHELAAAIERTRAAVQDLMHVNDWMSEKFEKDPFPFTKAGTAQHQLGDHLAEWVRATREVKPDESAN
jgi:hypothetical protein